MCKKYLRSSKVSSADAFVEEARLWAKELCRAESRGPGDYANAMTRIARGAAVPFGFLWNLHYRLPKSISAHLYASLGAFYIDEQRHRYREERTSTVAITSLGRALLRAADRLGSPESGDLD